MFVYGHPIKGSVTRNYDPVQNLKSTQMHKKTLVLFHVFVLSYRFEKCDCSNVRDNLGYCFVLHLPGCEPDLNVLDKIVLNR